MIVKKKRVKWREKRGQGGEEEKEETRGQEADEEEMEKERKGNGMHPKGQGDERGTGVEEAFWGRPERVGEEPERLRE